MKCSLVVIAHNIRSAHNIGSLLRTSDGLGVDKVYFTGYTPYPLSSDDTRLPHLARKTANQINKTALGAEESVDWHHIGNSNSSNNPDNIDGLIIALKKNGYTVAGLEQHEKSVRLTEYEVPAKLALLLGSEIGGINRELVQQCDDLIKIPMKGEKNSFNVVEAATMALFYCVYCR
jgi:tRNA G18 (ribose-2'-O)-methylase SpoU